MNRFIHIGFVFPGVPKMRDLEPVMTLLADDWIRYAANSWILWTSKSQIEIFASINQHIDVNDHVFIAPLDISGCLGRMSPWVWTWLKKYQTDIMTGEEVQKAMINSLQLPKPTS